jgi:hypothetical protein
MLAVGGLTLMLTGAVIVTLAVLNALPSPVVAVIVQSPAVAGAVYVPVVLVPAMVPEVAVQVTKLFGALARVAVKVVVAPV